MPRFIVNLIFLVPLLALTPKVSSASEARATPSLSKSTEGIAKALSIDLGGVGSWGPSLDFEIGSTVAFGARVRFPNGGVLNYADLGPDSRLGLSAGAGVGVKWYPLTHLFARKNLDRRLSSLYLGAMVEYIHIHGTRLAYDWHYGCIAPQAQLGYRWRKGNWLFGAGADIGMMANVISQRNYSHGWQQKLSNVRPMVLFEGTLEVGYVF